MRYKGFCKFGIIKGPSRTRATLSLKRKLEEKLSKTMMKEMVWAFSCARDRSPFQRIIKSENKEKRNLAIFQNMSIETKQEMGKVTEGSQSKQGFSPHPFPLA